MKEAEMKLIAAWIEEALKAKGDVAKLASIKNEVKALAVKFPLYASVSY
jgi:glycine/serine hydroxymethyltransferase